MSSQWVGGSAPASIPQNQWGFSPLKRDEPHFHEQIEMPIPATTQKRKVVESTK